MLGYEWNTHSPPAGHPQLILTDDDINQDPSSSSSSSNLHRPIFDLPFSPPCAFPHPNNPLPAPLSLYQQEQEQEPGPVQQGCYPGLYPPFPLTLPGPHYPGLVAPKPDPDFNSRIGLNLGVRTYFAASEDELVSRLYRRSRPGEPVNQPKCQAEGCNADLTHAKHYHRRHKVCEFHSKAATVIAAGVTQRFCQQCSRFHLLTEFDNGKRSCRKRLADHNRRRRKSHQRTTACQPENNAHSSPSPSFQRSPSDSGANSSSSVTIAISPPRASFDSNFRQRFYEELN